MAAMAPTDLVTWNEWSAPVAGGIVEPRAARMDFELDPLPEIRVVETESKGNKRIRIEVVHA